MEFDLKKVFTSTVPFRDLHKADVLLFSCCDFRFRRQLEEFADQSGRQSDLMIFPGGIMEFVGAQCGHPDMKQPALYWTKAMVKLHQIKEIWLMIHKGCGAYKTAPALVGKTEPEIFDSQLVNIRQVQQELRQVFPDLAVKAFYMQTDRQQQRVEVSEIVFV